jgi:CO/xanthine dehydrogenase Mo-binding subunit
MTDREQPRGARPGHETPSGAGKLPTGGALGRFITTRVEVEGREEVKVVERPAFEPEPWTEESALSVVGTRTERMDALSKVTGAAVYTADVQRPGMLYAALLRSPVPAGHVRLLSLAPALALPGVRDAIASEDLDGIMHEGNPLMDPVIRFAGQPLAAICADTPELARQALAHVILEIDPAPHASTVAAALARNAPQVRKRGNRSRNSPRVIERGDVQRGMTDGDVIVRRSYRTPVALHTPLEPHAAVAEWEGDRLTVWESTQGIFAVRAEVAGAFGLALGSVRVIKDHMGGGFGAKNGAGPHTYVAAALARRTGRAVSCVMDRVSEQLDGGNRPATTQHVTLAARRDGTLTAIMAEAEVQLGVGGWEGGPGRIYHELYRCENVRTSEMFVYTNSSAMASFRAPGHTEGAFGLECAMDVLAHQLGMDPLELRRLNYADHDQSRGRPYTDKRLDQCYRAGAERFGWPALRERGTGSGTIRRGVGMASQVWGGGGGPPAYATVRINPDGSVDVLTGSQDLGTGSRTVFAQIAAEALGVPLASVRVTLGDTERTPYTSNSWGSITVSSVGPAVRMAAEDARARLLEAAAAFLETSPQSLRLVDGIISSSDGKRSLTVSDVCARLGDVMIIGQGSRGPNPDGHTIATFGAQFAEVEVDMETGRVRVLRIAGAHDSGRVINPTLAESQLEGGIIQGLGYALTEERITDHVLGVTLNPTMHDYKVPTIADVPRIEAFTVGGADVIANHTGAKGLAESPIIPTAPAIANAVAHAIGGEVDEIPLTPWRVLAAIARARDAGAATSAGEQD